MAELKNKPTEQDVNEFLSGLDTERQEVSKQLLKLLQEVTGEQPKMWGKSMIGFGSYHYKYDSGREGDWFITGFSPRKNDYTIYITSGLNRHQELLSLLGKHKTGKSCLYIKHPQNIDLDVLKKLLEENYRIMSRL